MSNYCTVGWAEAEVENLRHFFNPDVIGSGEVLPCDAPFPSTPILDNFNRDDGLIGGVWLGLGGSTDHLNIVSNQLSTIGPDNTGTAFFPNSLGPGLELYVDIVSLVGDVNPQILFAYGGDAIDPDNYSSYWLIYYHTEEDSSNHIVFYYYDSEWNSHELFSSAFVAVFPELLRIGIRHLANGDYCIYLDSGSGFELITSGNSIVYPVLGTFSFYISHTKIDNLGGGTYVP